MDNATITMMNQLLTVRNYMLLRLGHDKMASFEVDQTFGELLRLLEQI